MDDEVDVMAAAIMSEFGSRSVRLVIGQIASASDYSLAAWLAIYTRLLAEALEQQNTGTHLDLNHRSRRAASYARL